MENLIQYGDIALFLGQKGKEWLREINPGKQLDTHQGRVEFDKIVGKPYGSKIPVFRGHILVMQPRPPQFVRTMTHATNIIYEGDAVAMISAAGVGPGDVALEVGTGSGGLTYYLAYYLTRNTTTGRVVTVDVREDHTTRAKKNLEWVGLDKFVEFRTGDIGSGELTLEDSAFDAAFVDMPNPWEVLAQLKPAVKHGKSILVFLPNWYQVERTVAVAEELGLTVLDVTERFDRPMTVNPAKHIMRPVTRAIIYSGMIIHLLRTKKLEVESEPATEETTSHQV